MSAPGAIAPLIAELDELIGQLDRVTAEHAAALAEVTPAHRAGAENLLHYAHLRGVDVRGLQNGLHDLGATSLTTVESLTGGRLRLARAVLRALAGEDPGTDIAGIIAADDEADRVLEANADALLGPERPGVPARIMVTLPAEAAADPGLVRGFAEAGMDLARINCAHDGPAAWAAMIDHVRAAAAAVGREIPVSMDLAGPKLRTGPIAPGPRVGRARVLRDDSGTVIAPARLWLTAADDPDPAPAPETPAPGRPALAVRVDRAWLGRLRPGSVIGLVDARDLRREFTVVAAGAAGALAEGRRNAWVPEGALLRHAHEATPARGIPATVRRLRLHRGDLLHLTDEPILAEPAAPGAPGRISCTIGAAVRALRPGDAVLFDDGAIGAEVERLEPTPGGHVDAVLRVTRARPGGANLAAGKGVNLPDTPLPLPSLTPEDAEHLRFVVEHADIAAVSFIRTPGDVAHVLGVLGELAAEHDRAGRPELAARARDLGLILKIETIPGFRNLPGIMLAAMARDEVGVMIARGDLAVELGFDRMGEVPGQILALAQAARMPVVLGTQVLETLAKRGLPSRAEITDAAHALRAECVMLNKGPFIVDAIAALDDLARALGRSRRKNRILLRRIRSWDGAGR